MNMIVKLPKTEKQSLPSAPSRLSWAKSKGRRTRRCWSGRLTSLCTSSTTWHQKKSPSWKDQPVRS